MYFVYILYSPSLDRYYIGQTAELPSRFRYHLDGRTRSTSTASDWLIVFREALPTLREAMQLERRIKRTKSVKSIARFVRDPRNLQHCPVMLADWLRDQAVQQRPDLVACGESRDFGS